MLVVPRGSICNTAIVKHAPMDNTKIKLRILAALARLALQVEEVRLEVAVLITTRLGTAPYVSLENILKMVITR